MVVDNDENVVVAVALGNDIDLAVAEQEKVNFIANGESGNVADEVVVDDLVLKASKDFVNMNCNIKGGFYIQNKNF